ncbi:MAG: hypothetical protein GXP45_04445 [bacterium]|nr:hypothetical protein [bacterium]
MKKGIIVVLSILSVSIALPAMASKPTNLSGQKIQKQTRMQVREVKEKLSKEERFQKREEARLAREEKRTEKFTEKYGKKTALMVRHFDHKLVIFEKHMKDEILLKIYPIFIDKIDFFIEKVEAQDVNEELKTERINYLSALSTTIQEELANLVSLVDEDTTGTGDIANTEEE